MRRELYTAGVGESLLFPELGALCRDLKRHWVLDREDVEVGKGSAKVRPKSKGGTRSE